MSPIKTAPAALQVDDEQLRAKYIEEVLSLLYPGSGPTATEYLVIPNARKPRLLVPADDRRVAAGAVRRYAEPQSRLARLKRDAVVAALRTGASGMLLRDRLTVRPGADSIDAYLARHLGAGLRLSVHIGPARANRKPVLQLLDGAGRTLAFAKLGTAALTRRLVRAEADALAAVGAAGLTQIQVPSVLHAGQWGEHEVLVQSALPVWQPRVAMPASRLAAAMLEVARCCGTGQGRLNGSGYWNRLRARLDAVEGHAEGAALRTAAERVARAAGDVELRFGSWHGDWSPWNMATVEGSVLVWDWERFTPGVPVGYDGLHHALQLGIARAPSAGDAVNELVAAAPDLLLPFGVAGRQAVDVTALLYLIDLATRYVTDRQAEAGARLGVLGSWLLPVLVARVEAL
ncbi:hypothetical protein [Dactylosporangium matsuzakiense]|uniref:Phosphotransferase family enzyme n=1 Tax=Dactylosporangium matsuzakiense TaxID=53360 RepID=A0A9W6KF69_9ACTN|nr:hypothetical protein [Dactylosporangium matsuzakiense]UWZ44242.1 hypothetical protein Dmats_43860 [Dactylosporangium matsuzakiense]GLK99613.1 hypothetical protein GCM10017581_013540 [Dactylosporangium matsuzakiense]